jgi:lantibiotic leader peptide-processing serine protease
MGGGCMHVRLRVLLLALAAAVAFVAVGTAATGSSTGAAANYIVVYKGQSVPSNAATTIASAGGALVYAYDQIGVAVARSDSASFRDKLLADNRVDNASSTAGFATQLPDEQTDAGPSDLPNAPASDSDSLSGLQWDMRQIHTPEAHSITGGSPSVLVGDIDTGIDFNHPDLTANIDVANSANCVSGAPVPGTAAQDDNGHGTHTAGTIAAASNGIGIVGVAPNVKIAGIKAGNAAGFFFPEAVVCAFMWAATHNVDVTNNSYFADPWLFNCKNDPEQRAIWKAESRAIQFAEQSGVTVVAADGNQSEDLAHPTRDQTSPDNTAPIDRTVTNACAVVPVEVSGVIGVSAVGNRLQDASDPASGYLKSFYSSFGVGLTQVTAPGGDSIFGVTPAATNGRVLSTYPSNRPCVRQILEGTTKYCYLQGTSMASPHAAGVAALIISKFGHMAPSKVAARLGQSADPQACPATLPTQPIAYLSILGLDDEQVQACQGGKGSNSWYGKGQVNALTAVTSH